MRIAYVEDNAINLALVQRIATMSGHSITSYTEGEVALEALSQKPFDLIMMDVELAGEMNGLQVVRALRTRGLTTPIIAVTAYAMMGDREKCLEAGCNDYLPKPLPISDFLSLLAHYDAEAQTKSAPPAAVLSSPSAAVVEPSTKPDAPAPPIAEPPRVPAESAKPALPPNSPTVPTVPTVPIDGAPASSAVSAPQLPVPSSPSPVPTPPAPPAGSPAPTSS